MNLIKAHVGAVLGTGNGYKGAVKAREVKNEVLFFDERKDLLVKIGSIVCIQERFLPFDNVE